MRGGGESHSTHHHRPFLHLHRLDKVLGGGLVFLLVLYMGVTVVTYNKVTYTEPEHHIVPNPAASSTTAQGGGASNNRARSLEKKELQQKQQGELSGPQVPNEDDPIYRLQHHSFPLHVGTTVETIDHPGLAMTTRRDSIPKDLPTTLQVPQFFDGSHGAVYDHESVALGKKPTIRHWLGDGEKLMTPEMAAQIGSFVTVPDPENPNQSFELETIYCSIASYRDPECRGTVEDLYQRAKFPERIRVAILDQRVESDAICSEPARPCEEDPEQSLCKYRHLIDVYPVDARLAVGPVFARHLAHRHYRGGTYSIGCSNIS